MELPCHWWYDNQPHLDSCVRLNCAALKLFSRTSQMLVIHTFTHRCVTAGSIVSPEDYLVYPRREGYALLKGWQVLLRRLLSKKLLATISSH